MILAHTRGNRARGSGQNLRLAGLLLALAIPCSRLWAQGNESPAAEAALPDAPAAQTTAASLEPRPRPCPVPKDTKGAGPGATVSASPSDGSSVGQPAAQPRCVPPAMNWYQRFVRGPQDKPLTPKDKAWLAARNMVDPFNTITILGEAAISVGSDSHSPYGPGMPGYGRYVGVSFTQDLTGEFFGTFLIPTIAHQDPHYHRMPNAKIPRRILHAAYQVVWTQGDNGRGMPNYANLVGFAIDDQISNLYVPGRETNADAQASRYVIGLASAPIGNFITEFLPDVARRIHVQVVVIQRIINQVARNEGGQP
ncbi:MAG TPA: hypothetical protein VGG85_14030 [Terracidiphilus sp.]